ncbi:hypothetical protein [Paenarthrobacter sp. PH39-S1]|uniref:hypothetical protein n=1 Tax=Paenarthrobacter sp. PH39-S1 TaxID=3046204 RepID=UPI0024B89E21|nr:hypothetical protein [Paenarthrobacter sp. PH39-S1]MDJ0356069.1 hypothetical protein [Paenarthrobacter sp. PH39-S1]
MAGNQQSGGSLFAADRAGRRSPALQQVPAQVRLLAPYFVQCYLIGFPAAPEFVRTAEETVRGGDRQAELFQQRQPVVFRQRRQVRLLRQAPDVQRGFGSYRISSATRL